MKRRGFLGMLAAAPIAAPALAETAKAQALGSPMALGLASSDSSALVGTTAPAPSAPSQFFDFGSWFRKVGDREARQQARYISGFDPDILEMRLPLNTKVRMQRQRNYERISAEKKDWFARRLRESGFVNYWQD